MIFFHRTCCNKRLFNDVFDNDESTNLQPFMKRRKKVISSEHRNKIISETAEHNGNDQTYVLNFVFKV